MTVDNIASIAEAGVDMFVAGSAILKAPRTQEAYKEVPNLYDDVTYVYDDVTYRMPGGLQGGTKPL